MTTVNTEEKRAELRRAALEYHALPRPGKIAIAATKQLVNQRDLALAYSPGVASASEEIVLEGFPAGACPTGVAGHCQLTLAGKQPGRRDGHAARAA